MWKKLSFFPDVTGGQNKKRFCIWLEKMYKVTVTYIFPVRGHSFGQCNHNFGIMKNQIRKKQRSLKIWNCNWKILCCAVIHFHHLSFKHNRELIYNWITALDPNLPCPVGKKETFKIQPVRHNCALNHLKIFLFSLNTPKKTEVWM